jgi:uncharacterized protein (TIGR02646 family)
VRRRTPIPPCPPCLLPQGSQGAKERANAIAHFTASDGARRKFDFKIYRDQAVSDALLQAFDYVCAYCESPTGKIEIEHYRPKSAVRTDAGLRPKGYYWLAATWENLLPSCHECNQELWENGPGGPRYKSGKGNWFPLADESARATSEREELRERPLLLHPYFDEPADHLEFLDGGDVQARKDANGVPSPQGEETICILGLNRHGLPQARKAWLLNLKYVERDLYRARRRWQRRQDEASAETYRDRLAEYESFLKRGKGYSAVAAQYLRVREGDGGDDGSVSSAPLRHPAP